MRIDIHIYCSPHSHQCYMYHIQMDEFYLKATQIVYHSITVMLQCACFLPYDHYAKSHSRNMRLKGTHCPYRRRSNSLSKYMWQLPMQIVLET